MKHSPTDPGTKMMQQIRASFILSGTTFTAWCRSQGMDPSLVRQAVFGTWGGPKGRAVKARALRAAGLKDAA